MTGRNYMKGLAIVLTIAVLVGMSIVVFSGSAYSLEDESNNSFNLELRTNYYLNHEDYPILKYEFLVPLYGSDDSLLFFSPKYHEDTHDDSHEWQLGLGYRHMLFGDRLILGGNIYYDTRLSHTGNEFEQVGLGVEVMGEWFEMRANGYLSLSNPAVVDSRREYYFAERSLSYRDISRYETPMSGFDAEVGFRLPYVSNYVETWVYGGGYYFEPTGSVGGSVDPMVGYQARVKVMPTDYLHLDFRVRDDNIRGTDYYGSVNVEVPFSIENLVAGKNPFEGLKKDEIFEGSRPLEDRLYAQVERDPDIITGLSGDEVTNNGVLQDLLYVDNTYTGGASDGSWSDPYTSIAVALGVYNPAGEVLFVLAGDTVAGYAGFSVAADNTTIWGQGYNIPGVGLPHGLSAAWPVINHAVTINASNVEISGLKFTGSNRTYAVRIADGSGFNLHHNYFEKSGTGHQYGIMAWNLTGDIGGFDAPVVIEGNYFNVESTDFNYGYGILMGTSGTIYAHISDNVMGTDTYKIHGDRGAFGIYLTSSTGGVATNIIGNDMYCYADNIVRGINIISPGNVEGAIEGNTIDVESSLKVDGMFLRGYNASVGMFLISGNDMEVTGETSFGVRIYGDDIYTKIDDNILLVENGATGGSNSGIYEVAYTGDIGGWGSISGNTLSVGGDTAFGVYVRTDGSGSMIGNASDVFDMSDNVIDVDAAAGGGYGGILYADGDVFASVTGNDLLDGITGTTAYGLYLGSVNGNMGSAATPVGVIDNDFYAEATTGAGYGLFLSADNGTMDYTITENHIYAYSSSGTWDLDNLGLFDPVYIRADVANGVGSGTLSDPYSPGDGLSVGGNIYALDTGGSYTTAGLTMGVPHTALFAAPGDSPLFTRGLTLNAQNALVMGLGFDLDNTDYAAIDINNASRTKIRDNTIDATHNAYDTVGILCEFGGSDIGSATNPMLIKNNTMTINSDNMTACGILLLTDYNLFADITGNNMSGGITGKSYSWGICLHAERVGYDGTTINPAEVSNNTIAINSESNAYGIEIHGDDDLFAEIEGNNMTSGIAGDNDAYGISLSSSGGDIGSTTNLVKVYENSIVVTGTNGFAYGINIETPQNIFADIINNDLTGTITGYNDAYGISLSSSGDIGSTTNLVKVYENSIVVTGINGSAYGINIETPQNIFADIINNDLTGTITGYNDAYGISLSSSGGDIGSTTNLVKVYENSIAVTGTNGFAYGINIETPQNIFADIINNDLTGTITGYNDAYGISLSSSGGSIGSFTFPILIHNNPMVVTSTNNRAFGINLETNMEIEADIKNNNITVTSNKEYAYGIRLETHVLFADIDGNDMSGGINGYNDAYGIYINVSGGVGTSPYLPSIFDNTLDVLSDFGDAYGIGIYSAYHIQAEVTYNKIDVAGLYKTIGIYLNAGHIGFDGGSIDPVPIDHNEVDAFSYLNDAIGVATLASAYNYSHITYNTLTVTSNSPSNIAEAAYLEGNRIGYSTTPTLFQNNIGTIDGPAVRYMLHLMTTNIGGGNFVNWGTGGTANTFTVENGGTPASWTGNYDVGDTLPEPPIDEGQPVYTNFGAGDTLSP